MLRTALVNITKTPVIERTFEPKAMIQSSGSASIDRVEY